MGVSARAVQVVIDGIGDVGIGEWERVGVLTQGGGGVGVAETGLSLKDPPRSDKECGDAMAQSMQCCLRDACLGADVSESMSKNLRPQMVLVSEVGTEQPGSKLVTFLATPALREVVPQLGGMGSDGDHRGWPDLGGSRCRPDRARSMRRTRPSRSSR